MTKKEMWNRLQDYRVSGNYSLYHVYNSYSEDKERAFDWCVVFAKRMHAVRPVKVLSANTFRFTAGFETKEGFYLITPAHTYFLNYKTGKVTV